MYDFKKINGCILINIIILSIVAILAILLNRMRFMFLLNLLFLGSLNFVLLNRAKNSWSILRKLKGLKEVDFPKYKDASMVVLSSIFSIIINMSLLLDCFGIIDTTKHIRNMGFENKELLFIILVIICLLVSSNNASGIIITPCLNKGTKIFQVSENNVLYGNELLSRSTGSFKDGIIIGYYIFYFKDIKTKYKDKLGNIIMEGNNGQPFKIEISAKRSKKYFSRVLDMY